MSSPLASSIITSLSERIAPVKLGGAQPFAGSTVVTNAARICYSVVDGSKWETDLDSTDSARAMLDYERVRS